MNQLDNPQNIINAEYNLLSGFGNLGFYKSCEVTTIFLLDKISKQVFNYFSIFVFEEKELETDKIKYLTDKLLTISDEYRVGICRYYLSMEQAFDNFNQIRNSKVLSNISGELKIGNLKLINKQFVPPNGTKEVNLNKCLKNNFINGSYIYEFFNVEKGFLSRLTKKQKEKISDHIVKYVPINLHVLQDRIGREMGTGTVSLHFLTFPQDAIDSICHQPGENRQFGPVLHLPPPAFRMGWVPMNYSKLLALFLFQNPKNMVK